MKIGIDARFFGIRQKGLGRYTQKLVENLEKIDQANEYLVFLKRENFEEYQPKNPNFKKVLADHQWYTFSEQFFFPLELYKHELDLMHFPHFNVPLLYCKKFIVTIHDLTLVHFPTVKNSTLHPVFYRVKFFAYLMVIRAAIMRAAGVIAISRFTLDDVVKKYGQAVGKKAFVTYEACEDFCMFSQRNGKEILQEYGIIKPYLVYVGNAYPHKNLDRLVLAFDRAFGEKGDFQLVLVGKDDYFYGQLRKTVRKHRIGNVIFLSDVSDYELDVLFHGSVANVFPSLYEGFGLPPLEAMSKGVPVISSDHPCMREVLGESAHFFDGRDVAAMAGAMERIVSDAGLRAELVRKGYEQIKKYSWKKMAQETLEIYLDKA